MTKNKFLDDLITRLEEISKCDRGVPSAVFINSEEARDLLESDYVKRDDMTIADIPQSIIDSIYEDGESAGYEQGSFVGNKVKVPAYVAKWIRNVDDEDLLDEFERVLYAHKALGDLNTYVKNWLYDDYGNQMKLLKAIVNGYEIEQSEKLYRVFEPTTERYLTFAGGVYDWYVNKYDNAKQQFTEIEIKNLDERLWAFAVEVVE